jgi:ATP-dependent Clp protease ATP-binding subunit ClpC
MSNRFTERAQRIVLIAQEEAKRLNHDYVGPEHVLLGLIALGEGVAAQVLANLGVDLRRVRSEIEKIVGTGDNVMLLGEIPFTPRAKKVLEYAVEEAQHMGHSYVGTEHLLLGLIREEEGVAARVLGTFGSRLDVVRGEVMNLRGAPGISLDPASDRATPGVSQAGLTPTAHAEERIANLVFFLVRQHIPLNKVQDALAEARNMKYNNKSDNFYAHCLSLAQTLLDD